MPSTTPSLRIVKFMTFKGGSRLWSNRYHFAGGTPADATHWHTLMDAVVTAEKAIFGSDQQIQLAVGYAAGSEVPVASKTYTTNGTFVPSGSAVRAPGEVAALLRFSTSGLSTKNHPIYLFNYFHGCYVEQSGAPSDVLAAGQKTAMGTYASSWISGFSDGTITCTRTGPQGHPATGQTVEGYVTHRDFPYTRSM